MPKPLQRTITKEVAASDGDRHIFKRKEIGDFWVSSRSQWGDRFWQLDNETAGARAEVSRLHWDVALPDGSCLTDPQWAAQLDAFKRFTWSLFTDESKYYGRPLKPASASALSTGIGYLARWMIQRNFVSFSELDNAASEVFLDDMADETALADLQPTQTEETMPDHENDAASDADGEGMSISQVWRRVSIWLQLWRQAGALREAGIPALPEPPFNGRSARQVSRDIATRAASLIPPLPDEVALPIMNAAHRMIGLPAEEVIRLHEIYAEGVQAAVNDGQKWRNPQNDRGLRGVTGFQFSVLPGEMKPWHSPLNQAEVNDFWPSYKRGYTPSTVSGSQLLRSLICSIRDACAIVIQSETGLRVSELCGLKPGIDRESGLPSCVRVRRSYSGLNELFYVDGRLFKTVARPERVEWLVGSRPVGSKEIPPPVRALDVLTLVVLDEASMIDLPTLHAILRHMPEGARLLLTGDAAQLQPIGFGLVYHALVSDPQITANLTVIHRQSAESGIPAVSAAIRERRMPVFSEYRGVADGVSFVRCESGLIGDAVERVVLQLGGYTNGVVVVSPTKKGPGGVDALNARLHERLRPRGVPAHDIKGFNAQYYTIGDPVMWLRNDYSRGLFNGLIGQVKSMPESPGERWLEVLFDGESSPRTLQLEDLMDLTLAHAITCHKLQGSQAARVVAPIYESRLLDPSWVYTAITRAEHQVILVGDLNVLHLALKRPWTSENRRVGFAWPLTMHSDEGPGS